MPHKLSILSEKKQVCKDFYGALKIIKSDFSSDTLLPQPIHLPGTMAMANGISPKKERERRRGQWKHYSLASHMEGGGKYSSNENLESYLVLFQTCLVLSSNTLLKEG